jgi:hypothetical protein
MKMQPRFARTPSRNKYGAKKTQVGEIKFDSKKEAYRWMELQVLERRGSITNLQRQVKIELMGQYRPLYTRTGRKMKYVADFTYIDNQTEILVIEDVKGFKTREYEVKRAILQAMGLDIREV